MTHIILTVLMRFAKSLNCDVKRRRRRTRKGEGGGGKRRKRRKKAPLFLSEISQAEDMKCGRFRHFPSLFHKPSSRDSMKSGLAIFTAAPLWFTHGLEARESHQ